MINRCQKHMIQNALAIGFSASRVNDILVLATLHYAT